MFKIKTLNNISSAGLDFLRDANYTVSDEVENPDGILVRSYNMHDMELPSNLKAIARAGAGVNNIPLEKCAERGIVVFNAPGANANAVKELTIAALLLSNRNIIEGVGWVNSLKGKDIDVAEAVESQKKKYVGPEVKGKKLGVIGLGSIGVMVANAAVSLGMEVEGFDPYISVDSAWGLSRAVQKASSFDSLLKTSDYITLHVPLIEETENMMDAGKFALMKKGVRLLNMSRGGLVDNKALKQAIEEGTVVKYVTDFPDAEILEMDNVIAVPHLGASTPESSDNCALMAAGELKDYLENGNIENSVNYPDCELNRSSEYRITLVNRNIPNMVGQISTDLAEEDINILNMINRSKGDYAYTIIDIDREVSPSILETLQNIEGILNVRYLNN
ncbi:MAG: phosphoglycerate dehydrogenase [Halanaerobiales bacterium]